MLLFFKRFIFHELLKYDHEELLKLAFPVLTGTAVWQISLFIHKPLELEKKTWMMLISVIAAFLVNMIGNLIFVPVYGSLAAAYTTIAGFILYFLMIRFFVISLKIRTKNK